MKTFFVTIMIAAFLLLNSNGITAQTNVTKLNQIELFKQWTGNWIAEIGSDTTFLMECKSFHNGYEFYLKIETKGNIMWEQKTLMGYDKKSDKLIESTIASSSPDIILMACWFTSANKCEEVLLEDVSNYEKANLKWEFEFKSPDLLIWTEIVNNKAANAYTFNRDKK